jgi:hypothetical protein
MGHSPSRHCPSWDEASGFAALKNTRVQRRQGVDSKTVRTFVLFAATVLLLANAAIRDLHADNLYPNCTTTAIDTNSGLVTSHETSTGKIFYFQVTDPAQLQHLRIHQGIWIDNGQVSLDGAKPCACKLVNSPTGVSGGPKSSEPVNAGPASSASGPSPGTSTNAASVPSAPGSGSQTGAGQRTGPVATRPRTSLVTSPPVATVQARDLLVLRDGKRKSGSLVACGISTCLIGTSVVPRQNIQWIGLSLSQKLQAALPPVQSSANDELHLADGSIHPGALLGILADSVATVKESLARQTVKWVHLVPVHAKGTRPEYIDAGSPDSGNGGNPGNAGNPATPGKTGRSAPPAAPPGSTSPNPAAFPSSLGSKGGLWIGTVHGERTVTYTRPTLVVHHYTNTIRIKLREVAAVGIFSSDPLPFHRIGSEIYLINEGTQVEVGYQGPLCSDHAAKQLTDNDRVGFFWYKTLNEPIKNGIDIPPEGLYRLTLGTGGPVVLPLCQKYYPSFDQLGGRPIEIGYLWGTHAIPPDQAKLQADDWDPEGYRKMSANHARMVGDYTFENQFLDGNGSERVKVDWDICRVGSAGCVMGAPQFDPRPCAGPTLLGPCSRERNALAAELKTEWDQYQKYMAKVQENQDAYRKAIAECAAWDATMKIVEYAVGGAPLSGGLSTQSAAEIKEFQEALSFLADISEKIINGENPLTIPDSKGLGELAKLQWSKETITKVLSMLNAANPEALRGYLEECGAPVPAETYAGAVEYVKNLEEALNMVPEIQILVNRIRGKDLECQLEQWKAYQACVECARSQGTDGTSCNNLKPEGDWPDVP